MASFFNRRLTQKKQVSFIRPSQSIISGQVVSEHTANKVAAYYRGLTYVSTQMAKLPLHVKTNKNQDVPGTIFNLLNIRPNNEMTSFVFKTNIIQQAIHYGNGYAEIERNRMGQPIAIHLLDTRDCQKLRTPDGEIVLKVAGVSGGNREVYLPYQDVLQIQNFVTSNGQVGQGLLYYASHTLGISLSADEMAGNMFANGGMPSGVLEVQGTLSDEAFARIKEDWKASTAGKKSGSTAILEEGMKYTPVSFSPDLLQFLDSRKFGVQEIARFLGLPLTKLFDADAATYNNIEHAQLEVATDTLDAWARNIESEIDVKLLNREVTSIRSEFDMYAVFRGDMAARSNYFKTMMQNAAMTPNEMRLKEGMAPYEGGDRHYIANNNFAPVDRMDEVIDSQISKSEPGPKDDTNSELEVVALDYLRTKTRN